MSKIEKVSFEVQTDKEVLQLCKDRKLSVSSVKYFHGHDNNGMECKLKIGNKIVAICVDDGWGGGFQIHNKSANVTQEAFNTHIQDIMKIAPTFTSESLGIDDLKYSYDMIVDTMVKDFELRKDCKKKVVIMATRSKVKNVRVDIVNLNFKYDGTSELDATIENILIREGFKTYEIINKRYQG